MPWGLKRYYGTGGLHFITWSCYRRKPLLDTERLRDLFLTVLELMRERYRFGVVGYVVMPEHVHLLISGPQIGDPSVVVQAVKLGFVRRVLNDQQNPHVSQRTETWGTRLHRDDSGSADFMISAFGTRRSRSRNSGTFTAIPSFVDS